GIPDQRDADVGAAGDRSGRHSRAALASERRRVAVRAERPRPHDGVRRARPREDRRVRPGHGGVRPAGLRTLRGEHRARAAEVLRAVQQPDVRGDLDLELAGGKPGVAHRGQLRDSEIRSCQDAEKSPRLPEIKSRRTYLNPYTSSALPAEMATYCLLLIP